MSPRRWLTVAGYIPLIGVLGWLTVLCLLLLLHRETAGLYGIPYGLAGGLLARRTMSVYNGEIEEDPPAWEPALTIAADALLLVILLSYFA